MGLRLTCDDYLQLSISLLTTCPEGPSPPPDALFSMDWVEKTVAPSGRGSNLPAAAAVAPKDFYAMDSPGFIFSAPAVVIEEMFVRSLFGLPPSMKV